MGPVANWFSAGMEVGLCGWLRAAWLAGIFPIVVASLPCSKLASFHGLVLGFARRGKIMQSSSHRLTVPQRFFLHFYVVAVVWTTVLLFATLIYAQKMAPLVSEPYLHHIIASYLLGGSHCFSSDKSHANPEENDYTVWNSVILLLLMELHVLRRLFETIYVFHYTPGARMHILGYLTGLFFYIAAPLSLCCHCAPEVLRFLGNQVAELIVKGKRQMEHTEYDLWEYINPILKLQWYQWVGAAIVLWGWVHQRRCHVILGSLREYKEMDKYIIPSGDWFKFVSSPHYLAEIVVYAGLVVASGGTDLTIWLLFGFVVANLAFTAAETHRWYLHKFDDYPSNRLAIIPFIY